MLGALIWLAYELAAARVPQHRAALENLIRHETGLAVRFSELSLRWGWYGPEAVFHAVELGEPGGAVLLRAPRLIVALDAWSIVRSGRFEARRITLDSPDIDLAVAPPAPARFARASGDMRPEVLSTGVRVLARWRGGQIDIDGGSLRALTGSRTRPLTLSIRHARLQRLGAEWSADALVALPEPLGAGARLTLQMHGDPALPELARGTLRFEGQRLAFAGWRDLAAGLEVARYLPQAGSGNLELLAQFSAGRVASVNGRLSAEGLEWPAAAPGAGALALERVSGSWQLARRGRQWHFTADSLELTAPPSEVAAAAQSAAATAPGGASTAASAPARITLEAEAERGRAYGRVQYAPVAVLAAIARWCAPEPALAEVAFGGRARELSFDWSAQRPAGARLVTFADLEDLTVASASGEVRLSGLSAHVSGVDGSLAADLQGHGAQLAVARAQPFVLDQLEVGARLSVTAAGTAWRLSADDLEVRRGAMSVAVRGALDGAIAGSPQHVDMRASLKDGDVAVLTALLGPRALQTLGAAAQLTSGRIESGELSWRGPLGGAFPWSGAGGQFTGALTLRDASLAAHDDWPGADDIEAHVGWRGPRLHAIVAGARNGTFRLSDASLDWDARPAHALRFAGRLTGSAQQALEWLRSHPRLVAWAPALGDIDLRGDTFIDVEASIPHASAGRVARAPPRVRVAALLDGGTLRPVAGLPPIEALHGTLGFAAGHLQRSTLIGEWLGGPVSLGVAERREHEITTLTISARGLTDARRAVEAAGGNADNAQLAGNAEWSALLTLSGGADAHSSGWELHADSSLLGVASRLPEPFAKAAAAALPVHVEMQAGSDGGQLHVSLGDRLRAVAALTRSGDTWRIERGAVRLAATAPALPADAAVLLDGRLSRLDLPACLALWREAGRDAALPLLRARVTAGQLLVGARAYPEASVVADAAHGAGGFELESEGFSARVRWPGPGDARPARVHLATFNISQPADAMLAAALGRALAPAAEVVVDDLHWRGHPMGSLALLVAAQADVLELTDVRLSGAATRAYASARCQDTACHLTLSLDSADAAATLTAFGLRPDIEAHRARLEGEIGWSSQAPVPLATLYGHLHMQLEDGATRIGGSGQPFALLSVPALVASSADAAEAVDGAQPELSFTRLNADYELRDGVASTSDLHFDGDAEILMRGRIGLVAADYDEQAWVLRGEDRLPAAVRRLGPTPRVAAAWLSLRELFGEPAAGHARATLRLRGTWNDPLVTPAE
ncbi:MAG TPA: DUF3971 domain-containing protein [Steroidobacteraceae bacterium]|nr:DUF3971 domain-containing protein [Steroidobacteraceae bacterium]